jgi:membrane-associated phospholipid phosphatase
VWVATFYLAESITVVVLTFLLATMVSWNRWSAGIHRPIEVVAGALLGACVTFLFFLIFS